MHSQPLAIPQSRHTAQPLIDAAGHLALWPALYAGAVLVCFLQLAGLWRGELADFIAIASVICTATGTYLIDRVKLFPALIDPSDRFARPERYAFLNRYDPLVRLLAIASLLGGAMLAAHLSRWAPILILLSMIGATAYAPRPRDGRPRLKDHLLVKNLYTACGLVGFVVLVSLITWLPGYRPVGWFRLIQTPATLWAEVVLFVRVLIDAVLCDVDDEAADRAFATQTLVATIGKNRAKKLAVFASLGLACVIPFLPLAAMARTLWCASLIFSTLILRRRSSHRLKDFVDLRFPIEAAIVSLLLIFR